MSERKHNDWAAAHGATQRALKARKGPATEADRPPPSTFPGRKAVALAGQLTLQPNEPTSSRARAVSDDIGF